MRPEEGKETKVFEVLLNLGAIMCLTSVRLVKFIKSFQQPYGASIFISFLHMKKVRLRGLKSWWPPD